MNTLTSVINPANATAIIIKAKGIQIGDNTHSHDQLITPINFNVMNRIASIPENPIPLLPLLVFDILIIPPLKHKVI